MTTSGLLIAYIIKQFIWRSPFSSLLAWANSNNPLPSQPGSPHKRTPHDFYKPHSRRKSRSNQPLPAPHTNTTHAWHLKANTVVIPALVFLNKRSSQRHKAKGCPGMDIELPESQSSSAPIAHGLTRFKDSQAQSSVNAKIFKVRKADSDASRHSHPPHEVQT